MDGALSIRHSQLLKKLQARTHPDGKPRKNYTENVAAIRAELLSLEDRINGN